MKKHLLRILYAALFMVLLKTMGIEFALCAIFLACLEPNIEKTLDKKNPKTKL